jgi:hypothetical protein
MWVTKFLVLGVMCSFDQAATTVKGVHTVIKVVEDRRCAGQKGALFKCFIHHHGREGKRAGLGKSFAVRRVIGFHILDALLPLIFSSSLVRTPFIAKFLAGKSNVVWHNQASVEHNAVRWQAAFVAAKAQPLLLQVPLCVFFDNKDTINNFGAQCSICLLLGLPNRPKTTVVGEVAGRTPVNVTTWEKIGGLLVKTAAHVTCHLKRKSVLAVSKTWVGRVAGKLHTARIGLHSSASSSSKSGWTSLSQL